MGKVIVTVDGKQGMPGGIGPTGPTGPTGPMGSGNGGGGNRRASVILWSPSLTPSLGDELKWLVRAPGEDHTSDGIPFGYQVLTTYQWGDYWDNEGTTNVLLFVGEVTSLVFAEVTADGFSPVDILGGEQILLGCGGTSNAFVENGSLWYGWNTEGYYGVLDPNAPAVDIRPVAVADVDVDTRSDFQGAFSGKNTLRQVLDYLDTAGSNLKYVRGGIYGPHTFAGVQALLDGVNAPAGRYALGSSAFYPNAKYVSLDLGVFTDVTTFDAEPGVYSWDGNTLTLESQYSEDETLFIAAWSKEDFSGLYGGGVYVMNRLSDFGLPSYDFAAVSAVLDPDLIPVDVGGLQSTDLSSALAEMATHLNDAQADLLQLLADEEGRPFVRTEDLAMNWPKVVATHAEVEVYGLDGYLDGDGGFIKDAAGRLWSTGFAASEHVAFVPLALHSDTEWDYRSTRLIPVSDLPAGFLGSGGPVVDFGGGSGMLVLHLEGDSYQKLGAARVVMDANGPVSVTYVGDIITPHISQGDSIARGNGFVAFAGSGSHIHKDGYVLLYHNDWTTDGTLRYGVARCLETDIQTAIEANTAPAFTKWDGSAWTEAGLGGLAADLGVVSPRGGGSFLKLRNNRWLWVSPDGPEPGVWRIAYSLTSDGFTFTPWDYFQTGSLNEWYTATLYSGDPDHPDEMTGARAWFWTTESDPDDRWGTNRIVRSELFNRVVGPAPTGDNGRVVVGTAILVPTPTLGSLAFAVDEPWPLSPFVPLGTKVLLWNQMNQADNGLYETTESGVLRRVPFPSTMMNWADLRIVAATFLTKDNVQAGYREWSLYPMNIPGSTPSLTPVMNGPSIDSFFALMFTDQNVDVETGFNFGGFVPSGPLVLAGQTDPSENGSWIFVEDDAPLLRAEGWAPLQPLGGGVKYVAFVGAHLQGTQYNGYTELTSIGNGNFVVTYPEDISTPVSLDYTPSHSNLWNPVPTNYSEGLDGLADALDSALHGARIHTVNSVLIHYSPLDQPIPPGYVFGSGATILVPNSLDNGLTPGVYNLTEGGATLAAQQPAVGDYVVIVGGASLGDLFVRKESEYVRVTGDSAVRLIRKMLPATAKIDGTEPGILDGRLYGIMGGENGGIWIGRNGIPWEKAAFPNAQVVIPIAGDHAGTSFISLAAGSFSAASLGALDVIATLKQSGAGLTRSHGLVNLSATHAADGSVDFAVYNVVSNHYYLFPSTDDPTLAKAGVWVSPASSGDPWTFVDQPLLVLPGAGGSSPGDSLYVYSANNNSGYVRVEQNYDHAFFSVNAVIQDRAHLYSDFLAGTVNPSDHSVNAGDWVLITGSVGAAYQGVWVASPLGTPWQYLGTAKDHLFIVNRCDRPGSHDSNPAHHPNDVWVWHPENYLTRFYGNPKTHASDHAETGRDPLAPADIGAATWNHTHENSWSLQASAIASPSALSSVPLYTGALQRAKIQIVGASGSNSLTPVTIQLNNLTTSIYPGSATSGFVGNLPAANANVVGLIEIEIFAYKTGFYVSSLYRTAYGAQPVYADAFYLEATEVVPLLSLVNLIGDFGVGTRVSMDGVYGS